MSRANGGSRGKSARGHVKEKLRRSRNRIGGRRNLTRERILEERLKRSRFIIKELSSTVQKLDGRLKKRGAEHVSKDKDVILDGEIKNLAFFKSRVGFDSVVGMEAEKRYLRDNLILAIRRPELFRKYGKRASSGLILYGPPGVGKTHLIRALAGESGANLIVARFNQVVDKYWGNSEKNIHRIFEIARRHSPCIIFIDELDGLGLNRDDFIGGNHGQYMALVVNQLLQELDGLDQRTEAVFVVGATNRPWKVDGSLKRSGRFGDSLYVRPPSKEERRSIFEYYTRSVPTDSFDFDVVSGLTEGYSPADIEAICEKAKLLLVKHEEATGCGKALTSADIVELIRADPSRGAAVRAWYSIAAKALRNLKGTGEDSFYTDLLADTANRFKESGNAHLEVYG